MPLILIVLGAVVFAAGIRYDYSMVSTAGMVIIAAGVGLGAAMYTGFLDS